jgi:hypothetical protein
MVLHRPVELALFSGNREAMQIGRLLALGI